VKNRQHKKRPNPPHLHTAPWYGKPVGIALRIRTQLIRIGIVACLIASIVPTSWAADIDIEAAARSHSDPKIFALRGVFEVFSLGMDDLAQKLRAQGYDATATSWSLALLEVDYNDDRPIVLIGHSLGGRSCGWVSRELRMSRKRVPLVIIVDANLWQAIPDNVDRCVHLHVTNPLGIFHGTPVRGESPRTQIVNSDVSKGQPSHLLGVNHFNIDATDSIHQRIIGEIARAYPSPMVSTKGHSDPTQQTVTATTNGTTNVRPDRAHTAYVPRYISMPRSPFDSPASGHKGARTPASTKQPYYPIQPY
jgi:hypothetical protein